MTTNLTQHDSHGPDDHPKTIDNHHLDMSKDDGTDDMHGIDCTNLTQHDSQGPDAHPKTIDYHHMDMSIDDGTDEHGIDWLCGCHLVELWLGSWANHN
jgi:hypothetical protein